MPRRWSIRTQLLVLALAAMTPLGAIVAFNIAESANESLERAHRDTMRLASRTAASVDGIVRDTERTLAALAERPLVRALDPKRCDPILNDIPVVLPGLKFPDLNAIGIRDRDGNRVCSIVKDPAPAAVVRQSPAFQRAIRGGKFDLSNGFASPLTKRWIAMSAFPIRSESDEVAGLLFLRLDLRDLQERVIGTPPPGAAVGVFDSQGRYLMRWPEPDKWIGREVGNTALMTERARTRFTGYDRTRGTDGVERIYAFHPVGDTGWIIGAGVPVAAAFAPYKAKLLQGAGMGLLALVLAVALALRISAAIAKPIHALEQTARAVAAGDAGARAPPGGPPEVSLVADEFNRMLDSYEHTEVVRSTLAAIVDSAEDAIVGKTLDGVIYSWNPGAERLFGYSAAEAVGSHVSMLIPDDRKDEETRIITQLVSGERVSNFESKRVKKDGTLIDVSLTISPIRDAAGTIVGASKIARDITARLAGEARARRQSDFYAALSQTNQAIVRMHDPEGLYREICRICVEYGHATMAFIALVEGGHAVPKAWAGPIEGYLPGIEIPLDGSTPEGRGPIATAVREGRPYLSNDIYADPATLPWRERAAKIGSLATAALPFRRGGRIAGVLSLHVSETGFFTDQLVDLLTEMANDLSFGLDNYDREVAQAESLRQERLASERFEKIFDATPLAACVVRLSDGHFVAVNATYCDVFEYSRQELLGHTASELAIWAVPGDRDRFLARLHADKHVREFASRVRSRSGTIREALVSAELIEFMGDACMLIQNMDVTEARRAAAQLRDLNLTLEQRVAERTAELEAANRELDSFGRTIAHDLRAPLRSISRFNDVLRRSLSEDAAHAGYFERIAKNVARMDNMLTDLLHFARSGRATLAAAPVDMQSLATTVADELAAEAPSRPEIRVGALPPASGDASLLRQVWVNLLSNAIKYSSKVAQPGIEVGARAGADGVEYYVRDNGCGFDPAYTDKLFVVFQRLHGESEYEGNGIGLAIVHRIVERHGGRVAAHSTPGAGAEFSFTLPSRRPQT